MFPSSHLFITFTELHTLLSPEEWSMAQTTVFTLPYAISSTMARKIVQKATQFMMHTIVNSIAHGVLHTIGTKN